MITTTARFASLETICEKIIPLFLDPPPKPVSIKRLLDRNRVPRCKANPSARRGGGYCYYHVATVEQLLRRTFTPAPGRATP